jgi:Mrp family chromosome partitioning ATPase
MTPQPDKLPAPQRTSQTTAEPPVRLLSLKGNRALIAVLGGKGSAGKTAGALKIGVTEPRRGEDYKARKMAG